MSTRRVVTALACVALVAIAAVFVRDRRVEDPSNLRGASSGVETSKSMPLTLSADEGVPSEALDATDRAPKNDLGSVPSPAVSTSGHRDETTAATGCIVHGVVREEGVASSVRRAFILTREPSVRFEREGSPPCSAIPNASGEYRTIPLEAGTWDVRLVYPGHVRERRKLVIAEGMRELELDFTARKKPSLFLRLVVDGARVRPVRGLPDQYQEEQVAAWIDRSMLNVRDTGVRVPQSERDEGTQDGYDVLRHVAGGSFDGGIWSTELEFELADALPPLTVEWSLDEQLLAAGTAERIDTPFELRVPAETIAARRGAIHLCAIDASMRKPVKRTYVDVLDMREHVVSAKDQFGEAWVLDVEPGERILLVKSEHRCARITCTVVAGECTELGDIVLSGARKLAGTIDLTNLEGRSVDLSKIELGLRDASSTDASWTGLPGGVSSEQPTWAVPEFEMLAPARYWVTLLTVQWQGLASRPVLVDLAEHDVVDLVLRAELPQLVELQLLDDGRPPSLEFWRRTKVTWSDSQGVLVGNGPSIPLVPGSYRAFVNRNGRSLLDLPIVVRDAPVDRTVQVPSDR